MRTLAMCDNVFDVYNDTLCYPGGNAVNVAVNLSKLGADSHYLGNISLDFYGKYLQYVLDTYKVKYENCKTYENGTTKCCMHSMENGVRNFLRVDLGENFPGFLEIDESDIGYIQSFDAVLSSCNSKMEKEIRKLKEYTGIFVYDFGEKDKYRTEEYFSLVMPYTDIAQFSCSGRTIEECVTFVGNNKISCMKLFTRGDENPVIVYHDSVYEGTITEADVVDPLGAGDGYISALVYSLYQQGYRKESNVSDEVIRNAMRFASESAAKVCEIDGAISMPVTKE